MGPCHRQQDEGSGRWRDPPHQAGVRDRAGSLGTASLEPCQAGLTRFLPGSRQELGGWRAGGGGQEPSWAGHALMTLGGPCPSPYSAEGPPAGQGGHREVREGGRSRMCQGLSPPLQQQSKLSKSTAWAEGRRGAGGVLCPLPRHSLGQITVPPSLTLGNTRAAAA